MNWTQVRAECGIKDLDTVCSVMGMVDNGLMIEDYSDVSEGLNAIYGELLDESIKNADKTKAAVSVYLSADRSISETIAFLSDRFSSLSIEVNIHTVNLKEEDWAHSWKKYYKPVKIGERVVIVPMWEEYKAEKDEVIVKMDPGMAFGTGTHETTRLCALLIEKHLDSGKRVLDIGTGSGILAILAAKLGARDIEAMDIDPNAVKAAGRNCADNGVPFIKCYRSDLLGGAKGVYGFICANIVADIIIRMAPSLPDYTDGESVVVISGIIEPESERVKNAFSDSGFDMIESVSENDWCAFAFKKRG